MNFIIIQILVMVKLIILDYLCGKFNPAIAQQKKYSWTTFSSQSVRPLVTCTQLEFMPKNGLL